MSTYHHPDDRPSDTGPLWDAGAGVCCAAFQLGACAHTEGDDADFDLSDPELAEAMAQEQAILRLLAAITAPDTSPF